MDDALTDESYSRDPTGADLSGVDLSDDNLSDEGLSYANLTRVVGANLTGVMEFSLEPGRHRIQVQFTDTPIRKWSEKLSLLALALLFTTPWIIRGVSLRNLASSGNPKLHPG